jgi:hypothetical protein
MCKLRECLSYENPIAGSVDAFDDGGISFYKKPLNHDLGFIQISMLLPDQDWQHATSDRHK